MSLGRVIALTALLLVGSILFFGLSNLDEWVQDLLYNSQTHRWLLDHNLQPYRFIFYDGVKVLLILFALLMLASLVFCRKHPWVKAHKSGMLVVVLSAIIVPLAASTLKKETNMPCPKHSIHYGGIYPHVAVWEQYPQGFDAPRTQCWPAGHASGGFALLSLFFLFKSRKNRKKAILFAMTVGWLMGGYKMLIGDHYLSHTVITMLLSWLLILMIVAGVERITLFRQDRSLRL